MKTFQRVAVLSLVFMALGVVIPSNGQAAETTASKVNYLPNIPSANTPSQVYMPFVPNVFRSIDHSYRSPHFGFEASSLPPQLRDNATGLGAGLLRVGSISWRSVQPTQGGPYNWGALATIDGLLRASAQMGLTPIVTVNDSPRWATQLPTSCGPIRDDRIPDFAKFMKALATRYKDPVYNVHIWEIGNEVDVDPSIVGVDSGFGCWGDKNDPYFGGGRYGKMLMGVTPSIKEADPAAKVMNGGFILDRPVTTDPKAGHPERFFEGMLRVGAAPYLDYVSYHGHSAYYGVEEDFSGVLPAGNWNEYGGAALGKPAFLHQKMAAYGVNIPLMYNEASLGCPPEQAPKTCTTPSPDFYQAQANYLPRMMVRSLAGGVAGVSWYLLQGPGWRNSSLLDASQQPRPVYSAFQTLIEQSKGAAFPPVRVDYGGLVEAYRFSKGTHAVDVLWSADLTPDQVAIPQSKFISAYNRDGEAIVPIISNGYAVINVGFGAVYIDRQP